MAIIIVLDLSLPNELWHTVETLLSQVRPHWTALKWLCLLIKLTNYTDQPNNSLSNLTAILQQMTLGNDSRLIKSQYVVILGKI